MSTIALTKEQLAAMLTPAEHDEAAKKQRADEMRATERTAAAAANKRQALRSLSIHFGGRDPDVPAPPEPDTPKQRAANALARALNTDNPNGGGEYLPVSTAPLRPAAPPPSNEREALAREFRAAGITGAGLAWAIERFSLSTRRDPSGELVITMHDGSVPLREAVARLLANPVVQERLANFTRAQPMLDSNDKRQRRARAYRTVFGE